MGCKSKSNQKGFSLAEVMIATVILGIASAGAILPFTSGEAVRAEGMRRTLGEKLASDLVERIINTPFDNIVQNYNNHVEKPGKVTAADDTEFGGQMYANFSRTADCDYVYVSQETGAGEAKFILATVRVYYQGGEIIALKRLITKN